ncbi:hypothetical protein DL98DRAFT_622078 [Cadophora sp. DSE1049]|nr:hypothetical protein DL98DRAFT_622078 [Cadophora sp. DSE1049]
MLARLSGGRACRESRGSSRRSVTPEDVGPQPGRMLCLSFGSLRIVNYRTIDLQDINFFDRSTFNLLSKMAVDPTGIIGLLTLFNSTLQCFDLIESARHLDRDYAYAETKFNNLKRRLMFWGDTWGLGGHRGYDKRLDEPKLRKQIEDTLNCIERTFRDGKTLRRRYGLKPTDDRLDVIGGPQGLLLFCFDSAHATKSKDIWYRKCSHVGSGGQEEI